MGILLLLWQFMWPGLGDFEKMFFGQVQVDNRFGKQLPCLDRLFWPNCFLTPIWPTNQFFSTSRKRDHVNCQNNIQIPIVENILTYLTKFGQKNYGMTLSKAKLNHNHIVTKFEIWFMFLCIWAEKWKWITAGTH